MFNKIKDLKDQNLKVTQIARILNSDVRTINKYRNMSPEEFELLRTQHKQRIVGSKMDAYEQFIISWIKEFNNISGAQVFDWIKEKDSDFSMAERTVRSYVEKLRKKYELPKLKVSRQYLAIPETLPAEQAQVDMGQINLLTEDKKIKKNYLFTMVLSFSRYKFSIWQDKPFTSNDIIQCHHKAFEYFVGVPKIIVYDQDKTMFVKDNFGDIIKTDLFQKYVNTMNFKVHLCRAYKDFSDFDFNFEKSISKKKINILCEMQWIDRLFKLILLGPPGIGKTRIMVSLGFEALKKDMMSFCFND